MSLSPLRAIAALVLTLVAATLPSAPVTAAGDAPAKAAARANYAVPKVGSCHRLAWRRTSDIADPRPTVPCSATHTARTVFVKRLTGRVDWKDPSLFDRTTSTPCLRAIVGRVGSAQRWLLTAYRPVWFYPTKAQRARGAKWIRCDVVKYSVRRLVPLDQDLTLAPGPIPDRTARCLDADLVLTVCSRPHVYRGSAVIKLSGARAPSESQSRSIALRRCPSKVTSRSFHWRVPVPSEWRAGIKGLVCDSATRR